jgi:nucleoside-diphosphate-sugar epimerase
MALKAEWADRTDVDILCADIGDMASLGSALHSQAASSSFNSSPYDAWIHCASSGGGGTPAYVHTYLKGVRHLRQLLPEVQGLFVSSTSVYGQTDGSPVDETAPTQPSRETGRILLEAESETLAGGGSVLRLAGLYGPGRSVLLRKFLSGEARLEAGGHRWINQIHRQDAARALLTVLRSGRSKVQGQIFNTADNHPQQQRSLYAGMAERLHRPLPPEGEADFSRKRGWTSKRILNGKLRALGWEPDFPEYFSDWARLCQAESELLPQSGSKTT